jgi:hypothetical protein
VTVLRDRFDGDERHALAFARRGGPLDLYEWVTLVLAHVAVVVVGFDMKLAGGFTLGILVAVALTPLLVPAVRSYSWARLLLGLAGASIVWGWVLAQFSASTHRLSAELTQASVLVLLSGIAALVVLLWARRLMPLHRVVLLYGIGALADGVLFGEMSWKFDLAVPATLVVLGVAERFSNRLLHAGLILALGVYGALNDARSIFGFCVIAAALTLWQARPSEPSARVRRWAPALLIAALVAGTYLVGTSLLTAGVFGETLRERSVVQIETSGSLIAGGRPEYAATLELLKIQPFGYGLGVQPSWKDYEAGTSGLSSLNVDAGGYASNYMFGDQFNLHSVAADLWATYGWAGAALAVAVMLSIIRSMSSLVAHRAAATSVLFSCSLGLWYLLFGPLYSNWLEVCLALGLSLLPLEHGRAEVGADPVVPTVA